MKATLIRIALILFGTIFPLLAYETYLRYIGYTPLSAQKHASIFRLTSLYSKDEVLGWKLNPGSNTRNFSAILLSGLLMALTPLKIQKACS